MVDSVDPVTRTASSVDLQVISSILTLQPFRNESYLRQKYEVEGLSARQIGALTGCAHSTINDALERYGIDRQTRRGGHCPYGFRRSIGKILPDGRQQRVLKKIQLRLSSGWSAASIAKWLNTVKIKTPSGNGRWYGRTVKRLAWPPKSGAAPTIDIAF